MLEQREIFPKVFFVGEKNIHVKDGKFTHIDCEIIEIDNPMLLIKHRCGKRYEEHWFHESLVERVNETNII